MIYVVHEIEGGSILIAFDSEIDAYCYLHWEEALGNILPSRYTVSAVQLMKL